MKKILKIKNQSELFKKLSEWGFKINPLNKVITGIKKFNEKL